MRSDHGSDNLMRSFVRKSIFPGWLTSVISFTTYVAFKPVSIAVVARIGASMLSKSIVFRKCTYPSRSLCAALHAVSNSEIVNTSRRRLSFRLFPKQYENVFDQR